MRTITGRIEKLEHRFEMATGRGMPLIIASPAAGDLKPDWCLQILKECGIFHRNIHLVNLCGIPQGLNQEEREKFLRKRGAEICFPLPPDHTGPIAGIPRDDDPAD
jgi:hypothetical protein